MTNFEYYKDDIKVLEYEFGKKGEKILSCRDFSCKECSFYSDAGSIGWCDKNAITKWLYEEHKEQPKLTKNERKLCEIISPDYYIARDKLGRIFVYGVKPCKKEEAYVWDDRTSALFSVLPFTDCKFSFITWEDEEPWVVEDLLKLEVME